MHNCEWHTKPFASAVIFHSCALFTMSSASQRAQLRRLGFCGADDSVDPDLMALISAQHPYVEWGVLFRPDLEGKPRYATPAWVDRLAAVKKTAGSCMRLAGHLCGARVPQVLAGDSSFVQEVAKKGFGRVQVNATAINGVDTSRLTEGAIGLRKAMLETPDVEWIVQLNDETRPLWDGLIAAGAPPNMSVLYDASCGTGVLASSFPAPHDTIPCGYAGGMGPDNIAQVLPGVAAAAAGREVWVDMESSLRATQDGNDVFSIDKCYRCIKNAAGLFVHVGDGASTPNQCGQRGCRSWKAASISFALGVAAGLLVARIMK